MPNGKALFLLLSRFFLSKSFLRKFIPPRFLVGKITIVLIFGVLASDCGLWVAWTVLMVLRGSSKLGELSSSFCTSSSDNIRSSRDMCFLMFLMLPLVAPTVFSFGKDKALICFPRFSIVSWHSANFAEADVISQPCQFEQSFLYMIQ